MISFMIYYWLRYITGDSIRESLGLGLWEESQYRGDWITIVKALYATISVLSLRLLLVML